MLRGFYNLFFGSLLKIYIILGVNSVHHLHNQDGRREVKIPCNHGSLYRILIAIKFCYEKCCGERSFDRIAFLSRVYGLVWNNNPKDIIFSHLWLNWTLTLICGRIKCCCTSFFLTGECRSGAGTGAQKSHLLRKWMIWFLCYWYRSLRCSESPSDTSMLTLLTSPYWPRWSFSSLYGSMGLF